jgi:hypothetical protein
MDRVAAAAKPVPLRGVKSELQCRKTAFAHWRDDIALAQRLPQYGDNLAVAQLRLDRRPDVGGQDCFGGVSSCGPR